MLEMKAVFLPQLLGQSVILMSDNATVVAYLQNQGGTVSCVLCRMAAEVVLWTKRHSVSLTVRYILANQVLPTEWSLLLRVFEGICGVFGRPQLNLFATRANAKLPLYISPVPDPMVWKQDAFQHPWDHLSACAFPPFALLRQVLSRVLLSTGLSLILVAPLWPQKKWLMDLLSLLVDEPLELSTGVELAGPAPRAEVPSRPRDPLASSVEVVQHLIQKAGFSRAVSRVTAADLKCSTADLYQSKWTMFLGWCDQQGVDPTSAPRIAEFFLYLRQELGLSVPKVKDYRAALTHMFSLTEMDLAGSTVVSRMFQEVVSTMGDMASGLELVSCSSVFVLASF